ncbi:MAG: aminotransferase class V-fold PLP-dependent enzyme [Actinomycetota bacterium]|nr:aminotransferase class V-fold PLP-dependent enzyme [Actinomycetota bacterium]
MAIAESQALWAPARPYLNTASYGLPPEPAWRELQAALDDWRQGRTSWEPWSEATGRARAAFARLVGVRPADVAIGATASELVALVAAAVPSGARVVVPEAEFTSLIFPFLAHADRGIQVDTVPLARLPDAIDERTDVVAASVVQSATGELLELDAVTAAAAEAGAWLVLDATQACGWLPVDASRADFVVCAGYKWLMSPRGTAYLAVRPERLDAIRPLAANWWAGDDPFADYYGPPLRLACEARRLDTSPAWFSWVGAAPTLELVEQIGVEAIHEHDVWLANRFREGLGLEPGDSAIVSTGVPGAQERLAAAGIQAAVRAGSLRASFHVYNTDFDVDEALEALVG